MVKLLIHSDQKVNHKSTSFGGKPFANTSNFEWPVCESCNLSMQFLGKIVTNESHLLIFMCQNDPGSCDEWDANAGGNKVYKINPDKLEMINPPAEGITQLEEEWNSSIIEFDSEDYDEAREEWSQENNESRRKVLGQLFGEPTWLQSDDTPDCDTCGKPMRFVAQLEEGPNHDTAMNFGGGSAYVFDCKCEHSAKFLWQC